MKKLFFFFASAAFVLSSCSKEVVVANSNSDRLTITTPSGSEMHAIDYPFSVQGKASTEFYSYKSYAEAPVVNGTPLEATSIIASDDMIFVSWHTEGSNYGGAITAYQHNGLDYAYTEILSFDDTDWHDIEVTDNGGGDFTVYAVGQRSPDSSGYFLNGHRGAVQAKIDFSNGSSPHFSESSYAELPLHGYGANGVAIDGTDVLAITGNGDGGNGDTTGIYRSPNSLANVSELYTNAYAFGDGEYIEGGGEYQSGGSTGDGSVVTTPAAATFTDEVFLSMERISNNVNFYELETGENVSAVDLVTTIGLPTLDVERNAIAWIDSDTAIAAMGTSGLYAIENVSGTEWNPVLASGNLVAVTPSTTQITSVGSAALGVASDNVNDLIYVAASDGGLAVIAHPDYAATNVLYNSYELIGKFYPLVGSPFPTVFSVKDVAIYSGDNVSIACGSGGVFFIEKQ